MAAPRAIYVPPTGDEPLDAIELAFVRMMVKLIVKDIREEEAARARAASATQDERDAAPTEPRRRGG